MKIKITRASRRDNNKITIRTNQLYAGIWHSGAKFVVTFKGKNGKTHDVVFTASRKGTTAYADKPSSLRMPAMSKGLYYTVIARSGVIYV